MKPHDNRQQEDNHLSFADLMRMKNDARIEQARAVYAAEPAALELAAQCVKVALRGNSASIARPRRYSAL